MAVSPVSTVPAPLATAADFKRRFPSLSADIPPDVLDELMVEATSHIEVITSRRLAPFTDHIYTEMLYGIYPDEYGGSTELPLDLTAAIGLSYANALGTGSLVRHFWLDQFAPHLPELWSYNVQSMLLILTYGDTQLLFPSNLIAGPDVTDGHCFVPGTRVLTTDLLWVPIESIEPGDHLIAFDEDKGNLHNRRCYARGVVEATKRFVLPCYEVEFSDGSTMVASADHLWLVKGDPRRTRQDRNTPGLNGSYIWRRTDQLRAEEGAFAHQTWGASQVSRPLLPWDTDTSNDGGYLAAALDGEGWACIATDKHTWNGIGFVQRENPMLDRVRHALKERDFVFSDEIWHKPQPDNFTRSDDIHTLNVRGGRRETMRLLGTVRPVRLLPKLTPERLGTFHGSPLVSVVKITPVGEQEVVALQTSSRTYIAEGFAAHNCWLELGTFAPVGTRIEVVYSGGYTVAIPPSLKRACLFQAAKFAVLEAEQQTRSGLSLQELDEQISMLLAPWARR